METRNPKDLKPHPVSVALYGDNHIDDLLENVKEFGILVPLTITDKNMIISGHRRWRTAIELQLETVPVEIKTFADELAEKRAILDYNRQREKTFSQKMAEAELIKEIEKEAAKERQKATQFSAEPGGNTRIATAPQGETADIVGHKTDIGSASTFRRAEKVWNEAKSGNPIAKKLVEQLDTDNVSIKKAHRILTSHEHAKERQEQRAVIIDTIKPDLYCGDFRKLIKTLPDNSIDLILTDPPYPKEYLPLWNDLAKEAQRVLKPSAFLIAYSGQVHLPQVIDYLGKYLEYYWLGMLYHQGRTGQRFEVNMWNRAKPILFYVKPPRVKQTEWIEDVITSEQPDKEFHDWGQNVKPLVKLLETFSKPDSLVLDPFLGGGATMEACIATKRQVIGYEIDQKQFQALQARIKVNG